MKKFTNGLPTLVVETFPFMAHFCKPKIYKWRPSLVWMISRHQMVGWRHFANANVYNSVCCLEKALEWTKMSSTTGNKTCPTLFKAMTQGIFGMWTKLDFSKKVCQIIAWYCKEKSAKQASWPRRDLPLLFSVQQLVTSLNHWWLASCKCHELWTNSCLVESSERQTPKHGWQERYFWNIFRNSTPKCKSRTERPLFFSTMLFVIQKWSFPTLSLFSFHQTR